MLRPWLTVCLTYALVVNLVLGDERVDRLLNVRRFNPRHTVGSKLTPLQLGNGNFAFGADVTGLQTFLPFNTLSSWGWHNFSLPRTQGQTSPSDFTGVPWWTHGRLVRYDQPNPAESDISDWLVPQFSILSGRIGLWFGDKNVTEEQLSEKLQRLDLVSGKATSEFMFDGARVQLQTAVDTETETLAVEMNTEHLRASNEIRFFFDFPGSDINKFDAPFVGTWDTRINYTTTTEQPTQNTVNIRHGLDTTSYLTSIKWRGKASFSKLGQGQRYVLSPARSAFPTFTFTATFASTRSDTAPLSANVVFRRAAGWWRDYWQRGAFVDLTTNGLPTALELQRRTVLSQYLLAVNSAGTDPPQESGLVNNGWYGKYHMEMYLWHSLHWTRWGRQDLVDRSISVYRRFLKSSQQRAADQGYAGSRWGKMSDPSGRSAPGEINPLLVWQQPHPMFFAEQEYRGRPDFDTLRKWDTVLSATADFMASYAYRNGSVYDLGPPMYLVSENTNPSMTRNPTFELAYWRFGLSVAIEWKERQNLPVPHLWSEVAEHLAPLSESDGIYSIYQGANMTEASARTDHPAMIGVYGLLPPTQGLDLSAVDATAQWIYQNWNLFASYGWDFPMLAANAARLGDVGTAISFLLHEEFSYDDMGFPTGGSRVPTPYFPSSGGLLSVVAMLASGWTESPGPKFPKEWQARVEGFVQAL